MLILMLQKALFNAVGPSLGVMVGMVLYRLFNPHLFNVEEMNFAVFVILNFAICYATCFVISFLIEAIRSKFTKK